MTGIDSIGTIVMRHTGINDGTAETWTPIGTAAQSVLLQAAKTLARRLDGELAKAVSDEQTAVLAASAEHAFLPEHYWQRRHQLQRRRATVAAVIAAIEEDGG